MIYFDDSVFHAVYVRAR